MPNKHKQYKANVDNWNYSWNSYTGKYLDSLKKYLPKNKQRESDEEYKQRKKLTDPILMFATLVDSINGMIGEYETKDWGDLGDVDDVDSTAYHLTKNINGAGLNWQPFFKQVGIKQTVFHTVWGLVDGKTEENGQASVKLLNPTAVENWWPSENPTEVLVSEDRDTRKGIEDDFDDEKDYYVKYTPEGWIRLVAGDDKLTEIDRGEYAYYATKDRKQRILPIFRVRLPLPRPVGYLLAKKQNHIFQQKSSRDWGAYILSFALLVIAAQKKEGYEKVIESLSKGSNALWQKADASNQHKYIAPPGGYLKEVSAILNDDSDAFYEAGFKQYGDAAKQLTATQIIQESRTGIEAFLKLLVSSIDQFENNALWRLEQAYFPDSPSKWGNAKVKRSRDFAPEDSDAELDRLLRLLPNNQVPLIASFVKQITLRIYDIMGIDTSEVDEGQLDTAIEQVVNRQAQSNDIQNLFG